MSSVLESCKSTDRNYTLYARNGKVIYHFRYTDIALPLIEEDTGREWRDVCGGWYQVSNFGEVRRASTGRMLKIQIYVSNGIQHARVSLSVASRRYMMQLCQLVARAFLPKVEGKDVVWHLDGDRLNNHVSNLCWSTDMEVAYSDITRARFKKAMSSPEKKKNWEAYLRSDRYKENCRNLAEIHKRQSKPVVCLETGKVYPSERAAERELGVGHGSIRKSCMCADDESRRVSYCLRGKMLYHFKYVDEQ
jgi:hypothetical protein